MTTSIEQSANEAKRVAEEHAIQYMNDYDLIKELYLPAENKIILQRSDKKKICRFCDGEAPTATFAKEAHALPEALGNNSLFSEYECDRCNGQFGESIENDFGKWSKPMRTMMRIKGKNGVPTIKWSSSNRNRIEFISNQLEISTLEDEPFFEIDEPNKTVNFKIKREPYIPLGVLKTFYKIAITLIPEDEIINFIDAITWLKTPYSSTSEIKIPVIHAFIPGPIPNNKITLRLHRLKNIDASLPYMFLVLMYGNDMFQIFIPSSKDSGISGKNIEIPYYPTPWDVVEWPYGQIQRRLLFLSGKETIRDEEFKISMSFEQIKQHDTQRIIALAEEAKSLNASEEIVNHLKCGRSTRALGAISTTQNNSHLLDLVEKIKLAES